MTRYATAFAGDPAAIYRSIDAAGRASTNDPHRLVGLLFEEGLRALRAAAWAAENRQHAVRNDRVSRATAILFALEAGLDFEKGGDLSRTLAGYYHGLRGQIVQASLGTDPVPFREAADSLQEIAGAWESLRPAG